jgi:threonine/homoserine/homoserine lactone efflux protein
LILIFVAQGIGYGFAAAVQPGPFQTYMVSQSLSRGWRRTLPMALAPLISDGPIIALMLVILNQLPDWLHRALYVAGGVFSLYLAYSAFIAWRRFDASQLHLAEPPRYGVLKAALMNALSPGPYIFWSLVTGPILLAGWRTSPAAGIGFLVGFYTAMIASLVAIILAFGLARQLGPKISRILLGISALALLGFGLYQLYLGAWGAT